MRYSLFAVYGSIADHICKSDSLDALKDDDTFIRGSKVIYDTELNKSIALRGRMWIDIKVPESIIECITESITDNW